MFYPSFFVGGTYNDNVYETARPTSALGLRIDPAVEADLDNGIHKSTVYLNGDAQLYPGQNSQSGETASTFAGRAGVAELWLPTGDVSVRFTLDYSRQDSPFESGLVTNSTIGSATSFVNSGLTPNVYSYRQFSDTLTGALTVDKKFNDQMFVRGGVGIQSLYYEAAPAGFASPISGNDYNAFLRTGFYLTPRVDAFVEVGGDLRRYYTSFYDTNSYRAVAGLSTDMIGLFRGEAFGGYEQQFSAQVKSPAASSPTYGASLYYYPTRYLTFAATVNESYGTAIATNTLSAAAATNNTTLQALLEADYKLFETWTAAARGGYVNTQYAGSRVDTAWTVGAGLTYTFWRNVAVTLDDQYIRTTSNGVGIASYSQDVATLGLTYHY